MHPVSGVRNVAAIPGVALLAGAGAGLLASSNTLSSTTAHGGFLALIGTMLLACAAAGWLGLRAARPLIVAVAAGSAFFAGGAALAARTWHDAMHTTLRDAFDAAAGRDFSIYTTIEGVLARDASAGSNGVSLAIDVDTLECEAARVALPARSAPPGPSAAVAPSALLAPPAPSHVAHPVSGGVVLTVLGSLAPERVGDWRAGRRIRLPATLRRPATYRDPDVIDREVVLARQGTVLVGSVKSGALVDVVSRGTMLDEAAAWLRARVRETIARRVAPLSPRSAAIVNAIVIGDRAGLDPDVQRALQEAGTYHVIAISGGNIAILAGVLLIGFRLAGVLGRVAMWVAAAGLVAYGYLVGGGASVDRATLMAVVYFGVRAWDHRTAPLNTLAFVAALLVAANPLTIVDPAFVLTFGATLAILLVMPVVAAWRLPWWSAPVVSMFGASMAAEVALVPVSALVFSRVTVAGLALNFVAIPLMAIAQLAGMALVPADLLWGRLGQVAGWVAHIGAAGLVWSAELVRFAPVATWRIPPPHWTPVVIYYVAVAAAWSNRGRRRLLAVICAAAACVWIVAAPWRLATRNGDGRLHVTFLDVGQGDATAIRFPLGTTWLVDAGGLSSGSSFDIGDRVVAPVIRRMGVRRLDRLVLTHGDPDHIGGSASIVCEFRPVEIWEGVPVPRYEPVAQLAQQARTLGLAWRQVRAGQEMFVDGVRVVVRHPPEPEWERQRVRNDDSVVLEVVVGRVSLLLTGDIGYAVEPLVARQLEPGAMRIVKAPHHGSAGSSSSVLIARERPAVAVISVGRGNHFGHPAPEVVERYRGAGAEIFRTDEDGAIFLDTDGTTLRIRTFNGRVYEPQSSRRAQR